MGPAAFYRGRKQMSPSLEETLSAPTASAGSNIKHFGTIVPTGACELRIGLCETRNS